MVLANAFRHNYRRHPAAIVSIWASLILVTVAAFGAPFLLPVLADSLNTAANGVAATLLLAVIVALTMGAAWSMPAASAPGGPAKEVALLGVVVAADAGLRLIPSIGGISAIFPLIIVSGVVFGARFGFLVGSLSLLLSAVITGGIGPWLPYQMLAAGWVGAGAALVAWSAVDSSRARPWLARLCLYGVAAGLAYGFLLSITAWPLAAPDAAATDSLFWQPTLTWPEVVTIYVRFYLVTSLPHDVTRAVGNAALLLCFGLPLVRLLGRARDRLHWSNRPFTVDEPRPLT